MDIQQLAKNALDVVMSETPSDHEALADATVARFDKYINPGILAARKSVTEAGEEASIEWSGDGSIVRDAAGREYIDCLGGYGIYNFGIKNPEIVAAAEAQLAKSPLHTQELLDPLRGLLAELLCELAPADLTRIFFNNSGTEAVECALKVAMLNTGRFSWFAAENAYHGKTIGSLSVMGREKYYGPFGGALMPCTRVPFGDADALSNALKAADEKPAALILEPIQGEAGAITPPDGYFAKVRQICDDNGVILIVDEVQTCFGRTGTFYAMEYEGITPDIMCLGKSLGGSIMPMGATMGTEKMWEKWLENPFIHTNTFGGNPLACATSIAGINVALEDDLPGEAKRKGDRILKEVGNIAASYPNVLQKITGRGLLLAMHFSTNEIGYAVAAELFHRGVLVAGTTVNATAVRIEPALNIPDRQLDQVLVILEDAISAVARKAS